MLVLNIANTCMAVGFTAFTIRKSNLLSRTGRKRLDPDPNSLPTFIIASKNVKKVKEKNKIMTC